MYLQQANTCLKQAHFENPLGACLIQAGFAFLTNKQNSRFIQASLCKIQGFFKDFSRLSYSFQGLKVMKNPDLHVKIIFLKC